MSPHHRRQPLAQEDFRAEVLVGVVHDRGSAGLESEDQRDRVGIVQVVDVGLLPPSPMTDHRQLREPAQSAAVTHRLDPDPVAFQWLPVRRPGVEDHLVSRRGEGDRFLAEDPDVVIDVNGRQDDDSHRVTFSNNT